MRVGVVVSFVAIGWMVYAGLPESAFSEAPTGRAQEAPTPRAAQVTEDGGASARETAAARAGERAQPHGEEQPKGRVRKASSRDRQRSTERVPRPRWRPRQRTSVTVEGLHGTGWAPVPLHTEGALSLRALRQLGLRPRGMGLKQLQDWPAEPPPAERWDEARFARAFGELCPAGMEQDVAHYAKLILEVSREHGTDPSLLAALVYQQSECDAGRANTWGTGLTMLNRGLFPKEVRDGRYPYAVLEPTGWEERVLRIRPSELTRSQLIVPYTNLYLAAVQLRVLQAQCPDMDGPFRSVPHRHFVSHFIWGDDVRDAGAEDRVLEARRRLLEYYRGMREPSYVRMRGVVLVSPVDGAPRIATSGLGEDRDDGKRRHAGIDFLSHFGEPVRAIADGTVVYAGTDLANDRKVNVPPNKANLVPPTAMGARGLFVEIAHAEGLLSVYAHLAAYGVQAGDHVQRGQLLGYVGRTGIRQSDPHLHFGLFADGRVVDPLIALRGLVFGPGQILRPPQLHDDDHGGRRGRRKRRRIGESLLDAIESGDMGPATTQVSPLRD